MNKSKLLPPVIWLIGMPGVGKSSIATLLRSKLKDHSINQIVIDTDNNVIAELGNNKNTKNMLFYC